MGQLNNQNFLDEIDISVFFIEPFFSHLIPFNPIGGDSPPLGVILIHDHSSSFKAQMHRAFCQGLSTAKAGRAAEGQSMVSTLLRNAGSVASVSTAEMMQSLQKHHTGVMLRGTESFDRQDSGDLWSSSFSRSHKFHLLAESLAQDL